MLTLNEDEKIWLDRYRTALDIKYPGNVLDMIVFGSKARGDSHSDSNLDILLIIREGDWKLKWEIEGLGYELAIGTQAIPTIAILTEAENKHRLEQESSFLETVQKERISVR